MEVSIDIIDNRKLERRHNTLVMQSHRFQAPDGVFQTLGLKALRFPHGWSQHHVQCLCLEAHLDKKQSLVT